MLADAVQDLGQAQPISVVPQPAPDTAQIAQESQSGLRQSPDTPQSRARLLLLTREQFAQARHQGLAAGSFILTCQGPRLINLGTESLPAFRASPKGA